MINKLLMRAGVVVAILATTSSFAEDSSMYVTDPMNGFDEEVFLREQAEKDESIAHANAFLKTINGSQDND